MGNKFTLSIHLDHCDDDDNDENNGYDDDDGNRLYAGSVLKGKIIVNVTRGKVKADTLCLRLIGKENTIITQSSLLLPLLLPTSLSSSTTTTTSKKQKNRTLYVLTMATTLQL